MASFFPPQWDEEFALRRDFTTARVPCFAVMCRGVRFNLILNRYLYLYLYSELLYVLCRGLKSNDLDTIDVCIVGCDVM